jgi:hypothetical protein
LSTENLVDTNSIRAALRKPDELSGWVADRLKKAGIFDRLNLEPADPENDPNKMQIVRALNELIEKAIPAPEKKRAGGNLMDRRANVAQEVWTNRRSEMNSVRANLEAAFPGAISSNRDVIDFDQLTRVWLRCRLVDLETASIHHRAASLALGLFLLDTKDGSSAAQASQCLRRKYLAMDEQEGRPLWKMAKTPEDSAQAALCVALYSLWLTTLGHWRDAAGVLALGVIEFKKEEIPEIVLRAVTHLNAVHLEWRLSHAPDETDMVPVERVVRMFEALDQRKMPENLLFKRSIPGRVLAECFAARLQALMA